MFPLISMTWNSKEMNPYQRKGYVFDRNRVTSRIEQLIKMRRAISCSIRMSLWQVTDSDAINTNTNSNEGKYKQNTFIIPTVLTDWEQYGKHESQTLKYKLLYKSQRKTQRGGISKDFKPNTTLTTIPRTIFAFHNEQRQTFRGE